jgi:hypothetical protein
MFTEQENLQTILFTWSFLSKKVFCNKGCGTLTSFTLHFCCAGNSPSLTFLLVLFS